VNFTTHQNTTACGVFCGVLTLAKFTTYLSLSDKLKPHHLVHKVTVFAQNEYTKYFQLIRISGDGDVLSFMPSARPFNLSIIWPTFGCTEVCSSLLPLYQRKMSHQSGDIRVIFCPSLPSPGYHEETPPLLLNTSAYLCIHHVVVSQDRCHDLYIMSKLPLTPSISLTQPTATIL